MPIEDDNNALEN